MMMMSGRTLAAKVAGQQRWLNDGAEHLAAIRKKSPAHNPDPTARRIYMSRLALRRWHGVGVRLADA